MQGGGEIDAVHLVGIHQGAVAEALGLADGVAAVERAAATHRIPQPVGEGADTGASQVLLGRLHEALVIGNLAKVPALAVEVHVRVDLLHLGQGLHHLIFRVVAHQVEAEGIDLVVPRPGDQRVIHQLGEHGVFRRRVGAAGGVLHRAGLRVQTLVVPGHYLVEHGFGAEASLVGVVVDHVHHHVHADVLLDGHDHLAELLDPGRPFRIGGVGAFRGGVVVWVITPVEGVHPAQIAIQLLHHRVLLAVAGLQIFQHRRNGLTAAAVAGELGVLDLGIDLAQLAEVVADVGHLGRILVDGSDVEHRQQVQVADAALGQGFEVSDGDAVGLGQPEELATLLFIGRGVIAGQIPDMGLIDGDIGGILLAVGRLQAVPAIGLQGRIVEIHHLTELGVHGQAQGVGVGHLIGFQLAADRMIDLDVVAIVFAHQIAAPLHAPAAAGLVLCHGALADGVVLLVEQRQFDRLRSRCPQPEGDIASLHDGAVSQLGGRFAVEGIEGTGALHQGRPLQNTVGIGADGHQFSLEQGLEVFP